MPDVAVHDRRAATAVAVLAAKRAGRSGALWGALFGVLVANEALGYHTNFPTVADRQRFAESFGSNGGLTAVTGPARQLHTIEGFVSWRVFSLLIIVGAIWGLLLATRLLRGEEDAGRWEMLLSGRTSRRRATLQALAGMAFGLAVLWTLIATGTAVAGLRDTVGFSIGESLYYAAAGAASGAVFLAVGALTSQLASTRRQANGLAAAALGAAYVVRMVADSDSDLGWLRWASPLGWVENLAPLTEPQPFAFVPIVVLVAACAGAAVWVAGRRDVGSGALVRPGSAAPRTRVLGSPAGLAVRLERWVGLAWTFALASLALVFALVAAAASQGDIEDRVVGQTVETLGGTGTGTAAWLGYEFIYLAAILAFAAVGQIAAIRSEEADGHLDNLLARPVSRRTWLAGRVGLGVLLIVSAGLAAGVGGWVGVVGRSDIGLGEMLEAGLNITVPSVVVLGVGTLLYGLIPRFAVPLLYALVLWSFLIEIIGTSITTNDWLLDTAVLSHLTPVPAAELAWAAIGWLVGIAVLCSFGGILAFERRDLVGP
jgi:ABC-2 type transport system permease protein